MVWNATRTEVLHSSGDFTMISSKKNKQNSLFMLIHYSHTSILKWPGSESKHAQKRRQCGEHNSQSRSGTPTFALVHVFRWWFNVFYATLIRKETPGVWSHIVLCRGFFQSRPRWLSQKPSSSEGRKDPADQPAEKCAHLCILRNSCLCCFFFFFFKMRINRLASKEEAADQPLTRTHVR